MAPRKLILDPTERFLATPALIATGQPAHAGQLQQLRASLERICGN